MNAQTCDALVLFGVTGDLAGKMVLPAIHRLRSRGALDVPVVGVARRDPRGASIADRVARSVERSGELDAAQSRDLAASLRYAEGDLSDSATFEAIARAIEGARRPLWYLAIPPSLFDGVAAQLATSGLAARSRVAVEKPFGHDAESARALESALERVFPPDEIFRIDHYLAKWPVRAITEWRRANPWLEQAWSGAFVRSVQITMAEAAGVERRGAFYDRVGALRDVVQNHLLQVVALLAMQLPDRDDDEAWQDARVAALSAVQPVARETIVRGQYDGYRDIAGVAPGSDTETFIALRLEVDTARWRGVPFCLRAGKRLALTTTEAFARYASAAGSASHVRFGLGPGDVDIAVALASARETRDASAREMRVALGCDEDCDAYETLIDAAMRGERAYSERFDGVLAAWRAVEPALQAPSPVHRYAPGSWGPAEAQRVLPAGERWHDPARPA